MRHVQHSAERVGEPPAIPKSPLISLGCTHPWTKFHRSNMVPLHGITTSALARYAKLCDREVLALREPQVFWDPRRRWSGFAARELWGCHKMSQFRKPVLGGLHHIYGLAE
jgi:hypothetical protein